MLMKSRLFEEAQNEEAAAAPAAHALVGERARIHI